MNFLGTYNNLWTNFNTVSKAWVFIIEILFLWRFDMENSVCWTSFRPIVWSDSHWGRDGLPATWPDEVRFRGKKIMLLLFDHYVYDYLTYFSALFCAIFSFRVMLQTILAFQCKISWEWQLSFSPAHTRTARNSFASDIMSMWNTIAPRWMRTHLPPQLSSIFIDTS